MSDTKKILQDRLGPNLKIVEPLAPYSPIGVGGPADFFIEAKSPDELTRAKAAAREVKVPTFILGGGSGVLISDDGFHGLVIRNISEGVRELPADSPAVSLVEVSSGTSLAKLIRFTVDHNLSGLEFLSGQPGTVGGALVFNLEAGGERVSENLASLTVIDILGQIRTVPRHEGQFAAATSRFLGREEVILSAEFQLTRSDPSTITSKVNLALAKLGQSHPRSLPMFRVPSGEDPARLISAVGLAGQTEGGAKIDEGNANLVVNTGHASASDVVSLISLAKEKVKAKYYTELKESFLYVGDF